MMTRLHLRAVATAVAAAGAGFCMTGCARASETTLAATTATAWACDSRNKTGQCKDIVVMDSMPKKDNEVRHVVKDNKFVITFDGTQYGVRFLSQDWLSSFLGAAPLTWHAGDKLMPYSNCTTEYASRMHTRSRKAGAKPTDSEYAHFSSQPIPIHLNNDFTKPDHHVWHIFPLERQGNPAYCLTFTREDPDGGSHDGAVHGETY